MCALNNLNFSVLILVIGLYTSIGLGYEGDHCYNKNSTGTCTKFPNCQAARLAVNKNGNHGFKRCGFQGMIELVCCPSDTEPLQTSTDSWSHTHTTGSRVWTKEPTPTSGESKEGSGNPTESRITDPKTRFPLYSRRAIQACEEYSNELKPSLTFHILEGEDAELGEFPHMVALGYRSDEIGVLKWNCGGSLVSTNFVLTAAHCIINSERNPPIKVKMGMLRITDDSSNTPVPQEYNIANITIHPNYVWTKKINDIALIKIEKRITINDYVHPACLYTSGDDPLGLIVSGWGVVNKSTEERSVILQKAKLVPVSLKECNVTYTARANKNIISSQICATDDQSDTCQGDSGGPLQVQNRANSSVYSIVGITSYGIECGTKYPGIYTRVSSYLSWIEDIVWKN